MLGEMIANIAVAAIAGPVRSIGNSGLPPHLWPSALSDRDREALNLYWDLKYLYYFGLPKIPDISLPDPLNPNSPVGPLFSDPTPTPMRQWQSLQNLLAFDALPALAGDPSPQPSIWAVLSSREVRLASAKGMRARFADAVTALDKEIEALG